MESVFFSWIQSGIKLYSVYFMETPNAAQLLRAYIRIETRKPLHSMPIIICIYERYPSIIKCMFMNTYEIHNNIQRLDQHLPWYWTKINHAILAFDLIIPPDIDISARLKRWYSINNTFRKSNA